MKAILMSDRAYWCMLMMNKKKKVEVRKDTALYKAIQKLIDEYGFAEFYVYCSKINRKHYHLIESIDTDTGKTDYEIDYYIGSEDYLDWCFDGKVAFKFRCYNVEEIRPCDTELLKQSCLTKTELINYLCIPKAIFLKTGYAIHISNLEIFDKPKELSEFKHWVFYKKCEKCPYGKCDYDYGLCSQCCEIKPLTKAPQSWCYVETYV